MWLVQYAGIRPDNTDQVMNILKSKNIPFVPVGIRPFTTEIMGIEEADLSGPVMAYGSCKMVNELNLRPGVFFDHSSFNVMAWDEFLHYEMVNRPTIARIADMRMEKLSHDAFVRPVMDLKMFSGSVKPANVSFNDFFNEKLNGATHLENALVAVSPTAKIFGEWRCFIVNRKLVTASQYRINGELKPDPSTPEGLADYVAKICDFWLPHDHCVMDVALIENKDVVRSTGFRVMEFNCINASGLYKADAEKLVDALNSLMV